MGVGIDLASPRDFDTSERGRRLTELMFTDAEHDLVNATFSSNLPYGYAVAFGAKEAAFKATAAPLRTWYRSHTEELSYDLRHFSLVEPHRARGEARDGTAQAALDKMGIAHIAVQYAEVAGMALVVATAFNT